MSKVGQAVNKEVESPQLESWFAIQTKARHEKRAAQELTDKGITTFLPLVTERHRWSDRCKVVRIPLFSCYVFVSFNPCVTNRLTVLQTAGVLGFVGSNNQAASISKTEINNVRAVMASANFSEYPFLKVGQRVRVRGGSLEGVEGVLVARSGERGLVVSIDAIQRSLFVRVEGYDVEPF